MCSEHLDDDGGPVYVLSAVKVAPVHFCWGVSQYPSRTIDGRPVAAAATGEDVLAAAVIERMASLCLFLEGAPPARVQKGSVRCPVRKVELEARASLEVHVGGVWPPPKEVLRARLLEMLIQGDDDYGDVSDLIGVAATAPAPATTPGTSGAAKDSEMTISWLCASARMNALATGSSDRLRSEAAWFEGLMEKLNSVEAQSSTGAASSDGSSNASPLAHGWQTSEGWVWMEVLDESISGTVGVLISGVMLTLASLVLFFGDIRLAALTMSCVAILIVIFIGYLASRSYEFGPAEAIAVSIFVGFACDYCVHVAQVHHRTSQSLRDELRCASAATRSERAMTTTIAHTGPALFGAGLTTVGSCVPLIACEIQILARLGEYIVCCTVFSLGVALTMLAPLLCVAAESERPSLSQLFCWRRRASKPSVRPKFEKVQRPQVLDTLELELKVIDGAEGGEGINSPQAKLDGWPWSNLSHRGGEGESSMEKPPSLRGERSLDSTRTSSSRSSDFPTSPSPAPDSPREQGIYSSPSPAPDSPRKQGIYFPPVARLPSPAHEPASSDDEGAPPPTWDERAGEGELEAAGVENEGSLSSRRLQRTRRRMTPAPHPATAAPLGGPAAVAAADTEITEPRAVDVGAEPVAVDYRTSTGVGPRAAEEAEDERKEMLETPSDRVPSPAADDVEFADGSGATVHSDYVPNPMYADEAARRERFRQRWEWYWEREHANGMSIPGLPDHIDSAEALGKALQRLEELEKADNLSLEA